MNIDIETARAELHDLIDQLSDDAAGEALTELQQLVAADCARRDGNKSKSEAEPLVISGRDFVRGDVDDAAASTRRRSKPIRDFDRLRSRSWPDDESVDDLIETVRQWRREGGYA